MPFARKLGSRPSCIDVDRLQVDTALAQKYTVDVQNRFSILSDLSIDDVESSWRKLSSAITSAAKSVIGIKNHIKQPWMSAGTFDVLKQKGVDSNCGLMVQHR